MKLYRPYPKQKEFHALGLTKRERALFAANQSGKTLGAANEVGYHAHGQYPDWWTGKRFAGHTKGWVISETSELVRDNAQRLLLGEPNELGTGTIPRSCIMKKPTSSRGITDGVDTAFIRHVSGATSTIKFKAYDQGRRSFASATLDYFWGDEEPPPLVYTELLARISATGGMGMLTLTPLLGLSDVVTLFYPEPSSPDRGLVQMDIDEAYHFDEDERAVIISGYPAHERDARTRGEPMLGSGRIFPVPRTTIECEPFDIPNYWRQIGGMDFGYGDHPFAGARVVIDPDSDCMYLVNCYKEKETGIGMHCSAVRSWGDNLIWAWPHDGMREWGDSGPIQEQYAQEGLRMMKTHSHFRDKIAGTKSNYSPDAGNHLLLSRMQTGRFKVFKHMGDFWSEFSTYHRKDGKIVKKRDDVICAVRQCLMMLRHARVPEGQVRYDANVESDWDPFAPIEGGV